MSPRPAAKPAPPPEPIPPMEAWSEAPPPPLRVVIRKRVRDGFDDEVADWPRGWPLPESGSIVIGRRLGGFVGHVEFDLAAARVLIVLHA